MGRRARAVRLALAASFLALLVLPSEGVCGEPAAALLTPYYAHGPGEGTTLSVAYTGGTPGLLQVHVRSSNGAAFLPGVASVDPAQAPTTFSFSCAVAAGSPAAPQTVPIAISRQGSGQDERIRIEAQCAGRGGAPVEKRFEFLPGSSQGSGIGSGFVFVSLLDPANPATTRIADHLSAEWTYLDFTQGVAYASEAHAFPSGSEGDAAAGARDFAFRFDGAELATLSVAPPLGDGDADAVEDFVDRCPDVPGQDDSLDADADTVPDACDRCPGHDDVAILGTGRTNVPNDETNGDRIPTWCGVCSPASPTDTDGDGVPDTCDRCPEVPYQDDLADADGDSLPDACDPCNLSDPQGAPDRDGDGTPDVCDLCPDVPGQDDAADQDGNGVPDACDTQCPCFGLEEAMNVGPRSCTDSPTTTLLLGTSGNAYAFSNTLTCQLSAAGAYRWSYGSADEIDACREVLRQAAAQAGASCP